ncbi:MAG: hypothetical protein FWE94_05180 [Coriobacteriia bacterium]|nr:hypothetical protein [Coriobacteriia bacterium]
MDDNPVTGVDGDAGAGLESDNPVSAGLVPPKPPVIDESFQAQSAKRIREFSKDTERPMRVDELTAYAEGLTKDDAAINLIGLADDTRKYKDIELKNAYNGAQYFYSGKYISFGAAESQVRFEELQRVVAERVRRDSGDEDKVTGVDVLGVCAPYLSREELDKAIGVLCKDERYSDVCQLASFSGSVYLYSSEYFNEEAAAVMVRAEEFRLKIVEHVRGDSQYLTKLTPVENLIGLAPDATMDEVSVRLEEITKDPDFEDITCLTARTGAAFAFSEGHMTIEYATVLLRVAAKDPVYTIAETVREDSRVYPRPTDIEFFKYGLFEVDRSKLDEYVEQVLVEYEDIERFEGPKGKTYLYSSEYLEGSRAELIAEIEHREN